MVSLLATSRSLSSGWDRGTVELYCTCMLPYSTFPYRRQLACLPEYSLTYFRTYYSLIHRLSLSPSLPLSVSPSLPLHPKPSLLRRAARPGLLLRCSTTLRLSPTLLLHLLRYLLYTQSNPTKPTTHNPPTTYRATPATSRTVKYCTVPNYCMLPGLDIVSYCITHISSSRLVLAPAWSLLFFFLFSSKPPPPAQPKPQLLSLTCLPFSPFGLQLRPSSSPPTPALPPRLTTSTHTAERVGLHSLTVVRCGSLNDWLCSC